TEYRLQICYEGREARGNEDGLRRAGSPPEASSWFRDRASGVRIGNAHTGQNLGFEGFHAAGVASLDVVVAQGVQDAMYGQVSRMIQQGFALFASLAYEHGDTDDDIAAGRA